MPFPRDTSLKLLENVSRYINVLPRLKEKPRSPFASQIRRNFSPRGISHDVCEPPYNYSPTVSRKGVSRVFLWKISLSHSRRCTSDWIQWIRFVFRFGRVTQMLHLRNFSFRGNIPFCDNCNWIDGEEEMAMREMTMWQTKYITRMIDRYVCKIVFSEKVNRASTQLLKLPWMKSAFRKKQCCTCIWFTRNICCLYCSCQCQNKLSTQSIDLRYPISDSIFRGILLRRAKYTNKFRIGWNTDTLEKPSRKNSHRFLSLTGCVLRISG